VRMLSSNTKKIIKDILTWQMKYSWNTKDKLAIYWCILWNQVILTLQKQNKLWKWKYGLQPKTHESIQPIEESASKTMRYLLIIWSNDNWRYWSFKNSKTMPVALPSCSYFLSISHLHAKWLMKDYLLAVASDFNPGSTPSGIWILLLQQHALKWKWLLKKPLMP
jgi:hypothetical protein